MDNVDKHRLVLTIDAAVSMSVGNPCVVTIRLPVLDPGPMGSISFAVPSGNIMLFKEGQPSTTGAFFHNTPIPYDHFIVDPDQEIKFAVDIAFGEPGIIEGQPVLETLQQMADLVDNLILSFRPHLT